MADPSVNPTFFPYAIPLLATFLAGAAMVAHAVGRQRMHHEARVFAIICLLLSLSVLPRIAAGVMGEFGETFSVPVLFTSLVLFIAPLSGHLIHAVRGGHGLPLPIAVIYVAAAFFLAVSPFTGQGMHPETAWFVLGAGSMAILSGVSSTVRAETGRILADLPGAAIVSGTVLLVAMVALDAFMETAFDVMGLAFIPLLILGTGLFQNAVRVSGRGADWVEFMSYPIVALGLMPIIAGIVFVTSSASTLPDVWGSPWRIGFLAASAGSLVLCTGLALATRRRADGRMDVVLVSGVAMILAILNLRDIMGFLLHEELPRVILMYNMFLALFIGVAVHLAVLVSGKTRRKEVFFCYGVSVLFIVLMLAKATFAGGEAVRTGSSARGTEHVLFVAAVIAALARSMWILGSKGEAAPDPASRRRKALVCIGYGLVCVVVASSAVLALFNPLYSINFMACIPVLLIVWGVFYTDVFRISPFMKRQILSSVLRSILLGLYLAAAPLVYLLLKDHSPSFLVSRIIPYGIPPLLSFICAAFLSLFVLGLEKNRAVTLPFSLICFCYAVLNLDILLVGIVPDVSTALMISRIDHFFLVLLLLGANFHLVFLITGRREGWWKVHLAYAVGFAMAPLVFSSWYFQGMYTYSWGFFARKAVLYDVMSVLWMSALLYAIHLLFTSLRGEEALQRRDIRNVIMSFMLIAAMSMANTPAIYGYEVYPLGTFIFIGLLFLAYSLFKFNLDMAMQYVRTVLYRSGLVMLLLAVGFAPLAVVNEGKAAYITGILLVTVLYAPLRTAWDGILSLFVTRTSDVLHDRYREFTTNLSHVHHLKELHAMTRTWIFSVFDALSFTSVFLSRDRDSFSGWNSGNDMVSPGLFGRPGNHISEDRPVSLGKNDDLIRFCSVTTGMLTREMLVRSLGKDLPAEWDRGPYSDAEIVLPVMAHDMLVAVFLIGGRADGSRYTRQERETLVTMGLFLGPHVENAKLLENLEQEVDDRTRDLNQALIEAMVKEKQIVERNLVIERQNQVSAVLLETSIRLHHMESLDDLFSFTLEQLQRLFPGLRGCVILEGSGRNILEASAFVGLSTADQKTILDNRGSLARNGFTKLLSMEVEKEGQAGLGGQVDQWRVFPLRGRGDKAAGYMILTGEDLDGPSGETVNLFIAQISAVVQNRLLLIFLERMASTDGLTGVYNRAFLDRELGKAIKHARRFRNMWFSLMIIDVNGLKQINDTYGHSAGDTAIVRVAEHLRAACRETDIVARIGGDEFAVLMPSTNRVQAEILLARIRSGEDNLAVTLSPSGGMHITVPIRFSIGLASSDEDDPDFVMKVADDLMYAEKQRFYAYQDRALSTVRQ